jgi:hypothetical protein
MMNRFGVSLASLAAIALSACDGSTDPQQIPAPPGPGTAYSSMPATVPSNMYSHAFSAQGTSEFGDHVKLAAGSGRKLSNVTAVLVTWEYQRPSYEWPITLNLYRPGEYHPFASVTQNFTIPQRRAPDATCDVPTKWRDGAGACWNGQAFTITFDVPNIVVPDDFVFGIEFDTQVYGAHPTRVDGPYNNLNVAITKDAPSAGEWGEPGYVYVNIGADYLTSPSLDFVPTQGPDVFWSATPGPGDDGVEYHPVVEFATVQ